MPGWNDASATMAEEPVSFERFFDLDHDRLFRVLCVITGNRQEAEYLSQDAFSRAWERWGTVGAMANPAGRAMLMKDHWDWDLSDSEVRSAWERGEVHRLYPPELGWPEDRSGSGTRARSGTRLTRASKPESGCDAT